MGHPSWHFPAGIRRMAYAGAYDVPAACYGAGTLYKEKLEAGDRADHGLYFGIILAAWLLLAMSGRPLIYSVAFCNGFTGILMPMSRLHWESRSGSGYPASWPEHLGRAGISGILAAIHMR